METVQIKQPKPAFEYKLVPIRECPVAVTRCDEPAMVAKYYREAIINHPHHNPDVECFYVVMVNTRKRILGHNMIGLGTIDRVFVHPREVFRLAIVASAAAIILIHNHPSGDPMPSENDIQITRRLIQAGNLLSIEVLDHLIMVQPSEMCSQGYVSMREQGYFY